MDKWRARRELGAMLGVQADLQKAINRNVAACDKLQAIIDAPEPKTGRVMSVDDLAKGDKYFVSHHGGFDSYNFDIDDLDKRIIDSGLAFHDKASCEQYIEYLKLEQELRRAQIAEGGDREFVHSIILSFDRGLHMSGGRYVEKVSFSTKAGLSAFRDSHTEDQLKLLIRGV